jgi:hypothetical protein
MDGISFFNRLATAMKDNPPYAMDDRALRRLWLLGFALGKTLDATKTDAAIVLGLNRAVKEALVKMQDGVTKMDNVNGWIRSFAVP